MFILLLLYLECTTSKISFNPAAETETLKKLEYDAIAAELRLDTGSISTIMDDRFISINSKDITTKHEELVSMYNNINHRLKENHFVDSFYLDDFRVDFFENTAVVTFTIVSKGRIKDVPFDNRRTKFYDVWIKRKNQWKIISMQASPIPKQ
jgi:hypothetical protein